MEKEGAVVMKIQQACHNEHKKIEQERQAQREWADAHYKAGKAAREEYYKTPKGRAARRESKRKEAEVLLELIQARPELFD